jgi:cation diffusion facilitator CzcD-associated flavoprotein CzcO
MAEIKENFDAVIVGAGFAGLYMLHRLRGLGLTARVFESGSGVGGTWFWNRYPGARCDVESVEYSSQFSDELQQEWNWTERYAAQPEILRYANHVADRFGLRKDIQFNTRVKSAIFDEERARWLIETEAGNRVSAKFCIMATGCLSSTNIPKIPGIECFQGATYHTGQWPHEGVDFTGKTVGVVGTGSSAIQSIPIIAEQAKHLFVFQRTPTYSVPARNRPLEREEVEHIKSDYKGFRQRIAQTAFSLDVDMKDVPAMAVGPEERHRAFEERWQRGGFRFHGTFNDIVLNKDANDMAAAFVREKIHTIVRDPAVAELLSPHHAIGCKRLCFDTNYYETFNRSNVTLVDLQRSPIEEIVVQGIGTRERLYELDCIVFATGFDAMTGALDRIDIRGRDSLTLKEAWSAGPRTYLGLGTSGFPNLFTISGPGSPSVLTNMLPSIEQHVNWITDCIAYMGERQIGSIEATLDAQDDWVAHVNEVANATLFPTANSW